MLEGTVNSPVLKGVSMIWLLAASLIWGFSFGILKDLTITVDPFVINALRTGIATIFFFAVDFPAPKPIFKSN